VHKTLLTAAYIHLVYFNTKLKFSSWPTQTQYCYNTDLCSQTWSQLPFGWNFKICENLQNIQHSMLGAKL